MCVDVSLQDVDASEIKVQVCVYAFDLLYLNGEVRPSDDENFLKRSCFLSLNRYACLLFVSTRVLVARQVSSIVPECQ